LSNGLGLKVVAHTIADVDIDVNKGAFPLWTCAHAHAHAYAKLCPDLDLCLAAYHEVKIWKTPFCMEVCHQVTHSRAASKMCAKTAVRHKELCVDV
jgi:hypothetical protein